VKIDLEEHLSTEVLRAVQEGAADVGICNAAVLAEGDALQTRPYRCDELALIVPRRHALAGRAAVAFEDTLSCDHVGLHSNSSIHLVLRDAAAAAGRPIRLRIRVTGLDAMCRMIHNGLGVGVMPRRAFELMHGVGELECVRLSNAWALRSIVLAARDFASLPVTARLLVEHLCADAQEAVPVTE
jgi:DNA-binding transcriptional LysR family regulator